MDEAPRRKCYLYLRKSIGKAGIDRQRREGRAHAARIGWDVIDEFIDTDSTAYARPGEPAAPRKNYAQMMERLRAWDEPVPAGVIAWHADRLLRHVVEAEGYIAVSVAGLHPLETVRSGGYELWTPKGRQRLRHDVADAAYEVDHLIDRGAVDRTERVRLGKWLGGPVPMGWKRVRLEDDSVELELDEEAADGIRWAYEQLLRDPETPLPDIIREWDRRRLRPSRAAEWSPTTVRQILLRPRNAGFSVLNSEVVETELEDGKAEWEPLVDEESYLAVAHILTDPDRKTGSGPPKRWFGSSLLECGLKLDDGSWCGSKVRIGNRASEAHYRCKSKGPRHISRRAEPVDGYVRAVLVARLERPDVMQWLAKVEPPSVGNLRAALEVQRAKLRSWQRQLDDPEAEISEASFARREKTLLRRINELREEIAVSRSSPLIDEILEAASFSDLWAAKEAAGDLSWQRRTLDLFATVRLVPVPPGRPKGVKAGESYFKPAGVRFEWKPLGGSPPPE